MVKGLKLGRQGWETLAGHLGVNVGSPAYRAMRKEARQVLRNYRLRTVNDKQRSPARVVATLKPLRKQASALVKNIRKLPPALRFELYAKPGEPAISDKELDRIDNSLAAAIARYQKHVRAHRPTNYALPDAVRGLQDIFERYCTLPPQPETARSSKQRTFIYEALSWADIRCPDPDEQRSRFNKLLARPQKRPLKNAPL